MNNPNEMTYIGHLTELRTRIIRMFLFAGFALICCLPFTNEIYTFVSSPLMELMPAGSSMIATEVASPFIAPLRLSIYSALLISVPYFFMELWGFISPGLYKKEKAFVIPLMLSSAILFYAGIIFAYFIVSPIILGFFIAAAPDSIQVMTDINKYLDFVIKLFFAFGFAFEIPVATFLVVNTGLISKDSIKKMRPYLIIIFFILGMLLTPPDIFSQLFLAIPMWLLFEVGLLISRDPEN
ncbi:MAG: twin-arginine translocase subunit TatC [Gammaproteobacteria bacterium]|jgi:sec-independent protein translocase protein TatC|nr:twin-arginine translocase subunit TatC [Gammaproteobacteria bacterium]MDC0485207.1 twin-arginine translocase subunit TatC [Gammaproteobacteria bacterium]